MSAQGVATEKSEAAYSLPTQPALRYSTLEISMNKTIVSLLVLSALLAVAVAIGPYATGDRFGIVPVGDSTACREFPSGSCLLVAPGHARDGDFVLARSTDPARAHALVATQIKGGKPLAGATFDTVGKILCCLPTQKVLGWLDKQDHAAVAPAPPKDIYHEGWAVQSRQLLGAQLDHLATTARLIEPRATYLKGYTYSGDHLQVCSGSQDARAGFVLADKPVNVVAVAVAYTGSEGLLWLRLGEKKVAVISSPGGPNLVVLGHPIRCRVAGLVRPKLRAGDPCGSSEIKRVQFWVQK